MHASSVKFDSLLPLTLGVGDRLKTAVHTYAACELNADGPLLKSWQYLQAGALGRGQVQGGGGAMEAVLEAVVREGSLARSRLRSSERPPLGRPRQRHQLRAEGALLQPLPCEAVLGDAISKVHIKTLACDAHTCA